MCFSGGLLCGDASEHRLRPWRQQTGLACNFLQWFVRSGMSFWGLRQLADLLSSQSMITARRKRHHPWFTVGTALALGLNWSALRSGADELPTKPGEYTIDVWQVEDGLPQVSVTSIKQTPDCYLWFGTFNGLVRFDGVRFTVFDEANTPALGSSRIVRLDLDQAGALWIITEDGALARLWEGCFRRFSTQEGLPPSGAAAVVNGSKGRLLLVDREGGVHWLNGEKWLPDPDLGFLRGNPVSLFSDGRENLWIWFRDKRLLGRMVGGQLKLLRQPDQTHDAQVRSFGPSRDGGLWLVISNRIWHCQCQSQQEEWRPTVWELPGSAGAFTYMLEDRGGNLWLSTYGQGLLRFGPTGISECFTTGEGLSHNSVRALWEDREGSIWIGTDGGGLNRLKRRNVRMYDTRQGLTANVVMSLAPDLQDPDGLWLGINGGGVNRLQRGKITSLVAEPLLRTNSFVYGIFGDRHGGLWIGSYDQGILRYHDGVVTCPNGVDGWAGRPLLAGLEDQAGKIWLAGSFGVVQWRDGRFTDVNPQLGWSNVMVRALTGDRKGNLYVGSFGRGLSHYREGEWKHYTDRDGLADNHIAALWADGEDTLWIGTVNGGLCRFRHGRFATISSRDGLPSNTIVALVEDEQGHLWLGSNRGLIRLRRGELNQYLDGQRPTLIWRVFSGSDGLSSIQCGGGANPACWKTRDGKLWFATAKGLAEIDPNQLPVNPLPPPVVIEEVSLDEKTTVITQSSLVSGQPPAAIITGHTGQSTNRDPVSTQRQDAKDRPGVIIIPPGHHRLEIRFTALSLIMPEKVRFRYLLQGLDSSWIEAGSRRVASYTYIPPGDYRFKVTACNNDGVWNEVGAVLPFSVLPYFWETNWFKALVLLGLSGGTGWLVRLGFLRRMQGRLERLERQHLLESERRRIAQDLHDDLGARLSQVGLLSELAMRTLNKSEQAQSYLDQVIRRSRETMQAIDEIVWAVDPAKDTLDGLMNYLVALSEELLQGTGIDPRLDLPLVLPSQPISAKARHSILLVVKEALNNCLKHSAASEVWIRGSLQGSVLRLQIEDNGSGFNSEQAEKNHAGHGLQNMRHRIENLGGSFAVVSQPGRGTRILLEIDLSRNA